MISRKLKSLNGHVGYKILRSYSPEEFFIALAIGLLLKSNTGCTHLHYGHKLTRSYLIPCAFSCATEPASVSHDRRETVNIRTWPTISHAQRAFGGPGTLHHWDGPCSGFVCEWYGSPRFLGTGPHTCRLTRKAFDEAVVPILSSCQQPVNQLSTGQRSRPNGSAGHANVIIWSWSL